MATGRRSGARVAAIAILAAAAIGGAVMLASPHASLSKVVKATPAPHPSPTPIAVAATEPVEVGYVVKHTLTITAPLRQGDYYWDESAAPATGQIVITVDLAAQTLSVFRDGYEIGTAVVIYGADDLPTPLGVYPITQKDAHHVSNLYNAPMPYMLRLTNDGISIHGSRVGDDYVTHGCIGVPTPFAKKLFGVVKLGDRVIVTRGERLDVGKAIKAA